MIKIDNKYHQNWLKLVKNRGCFPKICKYAIQHAAAGSEKSEIREIAFL